MLVKKKVNDYLKVFAVIFISALIVMLPNIIENHGLFLFPSDYALQQIPFYYHGVETVKHMGIGWDWYTDLGSDFLSSYSFYMFGSVFFWLLLLFDSNVVIYIMPVMIALKISLGSTGAFAFIKRYVSDSKAAFLGTVMYAFSGFHLESFVYNHFFDATALFPFIILSFEMLVTENRRGLFALCAGIAAVTNFFFFIGTAVFMVIYYSVKCICGDFRVTGRNFIVLIAETIIGTGLASVILLPVYLLLSSADRVGDMLYGVNLISYDDNTIIPRILQGFFVLPDPNPGAMLFESADNTHNWATNSFYLPVFTVTGVVAFMKNNRKSWITLMLKICFVMALIPVLNSMFSAFNSFYYARWYYMPVLIMCLATSKSIENKYDLASGIKVQTIALAAIVVIACLPDVKSVNNTESDLIFEKKISDETAVQMLGMNKIPSVFWQCIAFSSVFLLIVYAYNREKHNENIVRKIVMAVTALTVITSAVYLQNSYNQNGFDKDKYYYSLTNFRPELDSDNKFRISHANNYSSDNLSMVWGYMNAGCYHSIESNESDDFFKAVQGRDRFMKSSYREIDYPAYGLLSVKYLLNISTNDDLNVEVLHINVPGFSLYDKQGCYYIYKNDCFIPFGFMYDYFIDDKRLEKYLNENEFENMYQYKKLIMMRALVLSGEDAEKYSKYIGRLPDNMMDNLDECTYFSDCNERNLSACSSFEYDSDGFTAEISTEKPGLVYFSVPCSAGWSASINGNSTSIIKAHYGLSAVPVESGNSVIKFEYKTPGLKEGKMLSAMSLCFLFVYILVAVLKNNRTKDVE